MSAIVDFDIGQTVRLNNFEFKSRRGVRIKTSCTINERFTVQSTKKNKREEKKIFCLPKREMNVLDGI